MRGIWRGPEDQAQGGPGGDQKIRHEGDLERTRGPGDQAQEGSGGNQRVRRKRDLERTRHLWLVLEMFFSLDSYFLPFTARNPASSKVRLVVLARSIGSSL